MKKEEYICFEIEAHVSETETKLNELAKDGWILVCSYAKNGNYLIMKREYKARI